MTNTVAIWLGVLIAGGVGADVLLNDSQTLIFLIRKGIDLIQWMAFWR